MEQIETVADVLKNWHKYSSPGSTRGRTHAGLSVIAELNVELIAEQILRRSWHSRKVTSSMFKMATEVEARFDLELKWTERYDLARLLVSSLTYAGVYQLIREKPDDSFSPYIMVSADESEIADEAPPHKTQFVPFPLWTKNFDQHGNRLIKASSPQSPEQELKPIFSEPGKEYFPWHTAVTHLEFVPFRINGEFLDLVKALDADPATRLIHENPPDYEVQKRESASVMFSNRWVYAQFT